MRKVEKLTKIIASIGPASSGEHYPKIFKAGADIFRCNFSHGSKEEHGERFKEACKVEKKLNTRVTKFADMQGPKHRIGVFKNEEKFLLEAGKEFRLDSSDKPGDEKRVKLPHPTLFKSLEKGSIVLINDGQIKLEVTEAGEDFVNTKIIVGGMISDRKGFNIPNSLIKESCITAKDLVDIEYAIKSGFKLIVISFVQTPDDLKEAKKIINGRAKIIAKLEKPLVMEHLEEIISMSDAVMIGRGDFAIEATYEIVPVYQKRIIWECNKQNVPVIVATQMMESMIDNPFPTRAEISDTANAVYECADCVMLSAETTVGKNPALAIGMMTKVIKTVEAAENSDVLNPYVKFNKQFTKDESTLLNKITNLIKNGAETLVLINPSIKFVGKISKLRLNIPFFPVFNDEQSEQLCRLYFGCFPILTNKDLSDKNYIKKIKAEIAKSQKISEKEIALLQE